jgi:hemerythrin-like domain-containing protein
MNRHEALAILSSDHHKGLSMAKLLRSAKDSPANIIEYIYLKFKEFFETELAEHFSEEESILVPPLKDNELIIRMVDEHAKMREMLSLLKTAESKSSSLAELGVYLAKHIRFEERELFPMIENTLTEEKLQEISKMISARRSST